MTSVDIDTLVQNAESLYQNQLRGELEPLHRDEFVAIEPTSGDFFLGATLSDAIGAARDAHPDRLAHAIRIGHDTTLHFGVSLQ